MQEITKFDHEMFGTLEVVFVEDEVMFIAKQISEVLGYAQTSNMNKLIEKEDKFKRNIRNGLNYVNQSLINESGLYQAIFGSTKPQAKEFKRWVTKEVLPSIRKSGGYISGQETMSSEELLARAVQVSMNIIEETEKKLAVASKTIKDKNHPMSLSKMYSRNNKVVQAANIWLEDQGYIVKYFKKGIKLGWTLTEKGEELGFGSQVSDASIFWTPDVLGFLPSTKKLLEFANKLDLVNHAKFN